MQREKEKVHQQQEEGDGIGWGGQTLREQFEDLERKTEETGHYAGFEKLDLKQDQPIQYEQMFAQLRGDLVTARETSKRSLRHRLSSKKVSSAMVSLPQKGTRSPSRRESSSTFTR